MTPADPRPDGGGGRPAASGSGIEPPRPPRAVARTIGSILLMPLLPILGAGGAPGPEEPERPLRPRAVARTLGWLLLILLATAFAAACGAEIYFRLAHPYLTVETPYRLVPGVGRVLRPGAEVWIEERRDLWFVAQANGLGFLDREPRDPRRTAESCHVAALGSEFVEARATSPIDKFHVRLEELAARALPGLDVTTSAYGIAGAGQIAQLAYYDAYARRTNPELVVLVFRRADMARNAPLVWGIRSGHDPDRFPHLTALRDRDGAMTLRPPGTDSPRLRDALMERIPAPPDPWPTRTVDGLAPYSRLAVYLAGRTEPARALPPDGHEERQRALWTELLRQRPHYAWILQRPTNREAGNRAGSPPHRQRWREYRFAFTAFALDRFKERADRDGAALVVLATWSGSNDRALDTLREMARERGIPMIEERDYGYADGVFPMDARFDSGPGVRDAARHRMAAEALLAWLAENPQVCGGARRGRTPPL